MIRIIGGAMARREVEWGGTVNLLVVDRSLELMDGCIVVAVKWSDVRQELCKVGGALTPASI
jgi:hypothetical protein